MERRVFVAILLSFSVLYAYQTFFAPQTPPVKPGESAAVTGRPAQPSATTSSVPAAVPVAGSSEAAAVVAEEQERRVTVETRTVIAEFSNRGARLIHWRLKDYRDPQGDPVDLVPTDLPPGQDSPFVLRVQDQQASRQLAGALFRVTGANSGRADVSREPGVVTFDYEDASGLKATKQFRFEPDGYVVGFSARVERAGQPLAPTVVWGPGLGDRGAAAGGGSFFTGNATQSPEAIYHRDGKVERIAQNKVSPQTPYDGEFRFAGIDDHYFVAVAINPGRVRLEYQPVTVPSADGNERRFVSHAMAFQSAPNGLRFFVGPKQFDLLRAADAELVRVINFGFFAWLVVPLLSTLKWLYGFTGNYGWSIILLTIIINLVMFPLRHKSAVAMRKMQALQPQMKAIQEKYAHLKMTDPDRQKMNTEVTALYRERGVNPASGCVPMLLTLPVLLAFYALLSQAIELRGAPFTLWIRDLSGADPYYVIPALMGVTMLWQQKVTPAAMDPAQQKVMMIMPIMFTAMMIFSPSGVVLYWFVSNLWAIGQQYFTNWMIGPPTPVAPPATRRVKPVGSGRSTGAQKGQQ
jgi:YidC/Oxa1 family membrane protein insertase